MSLEIDVGAFKKRVSLLQKSLTELECACFASILGKGEEETSRQLASSLHIWLLGVPFANTGILILPTLAVIIAAPKQTRHLESLKSEHVKIVERGKEPSEYENLYADLFKEYELSEKNIATFLGDNPGSEIATAFNKVFKPENHTIDCTTQYKQLLEVKDEQELRAVRMASKTGSQLVSNFFVERMSVILDEGSKVKNADLATTLRNSINNSKLLQRLKISSEFNPGEVDWASNPQVLNGENVGETGVITVKLEPSYKSYASEIGRTYLVNASQELGNIYSNVLAAQRRGIQSCISGTKISDVYNVVKQFLESKQPEIVKFLGVDVGRSVGILNSNFLNAENSNVLLDNETLCLRVYLKLDKYEILVSDTLRVADNEPIVFTDAPKTLSDVAFELEDVNTKVKEEPKRELRETPGAPRQTRAQRAMEKREVSESAERAMEEHQAELKRRLQEHGQQKYADAGESNINDSGPEFKKFESFKREQQLPKMESLRVQVDLRSNSIILPICGRPVPFHINTFRSGSASDEGSYVYLRLNFNSPDSLMAKRDAVPYDNPNAQFVKSITLRSRDMNRMRDTLKRIQELKKEVTRRENEKKQLADVVKQDKLIESSDRRPLRLETLFVRPAPEGKRIPGALEIHKNGVRYVSPLREQTVEVLFSNVEHLFFQPNINELITLVHFHLKQPIMIGKRKTRDVQFYRDATDMNADDTGHRKRRYRYGDEDELEQEEEERKFRMRLNKEFHRFAEEIAKASNGQLEVDAPFRELGFNGVPFRANMFLQPTTNCLVQLSETPFFVVTLADVELAILERVRFGLKQFDIVFIFKNYKQPVVQVNSIPMSQLDAVKSWLNEVDIPFYEAELNFNWKEIMNTINSSPHQFFNQDGGWSFLDPEVGSDQAEEIESEPGEEEFTASEASVESEFSDEDSDSEGVADSSEESGGSFEESGDGEDWSDLEEAAKKEDRKKEKD